MEPETSDNETETIKVDWDDMLDELKELNLGNNKRYNSKKITKVCFNFHFKDVTLGNGFVLILV